MAEYYFLGIKIVTDDTVPEGTVITIRGDGLPPRILVCGGPSWGDKGPRIGQRRADRNEGEDHDDLPAMRRYERPESGGPEHGQAGKRISSEKAGDQRGRAAASGTRGAGTCPACGAAVGRDARHSGGDEE